MVITKFLNSLKILMKNTQVSLLQNIIGTHQDHWRKRAAAMQARTGAAPTAASFCPRRGENKCSSKVTPNNSPNFRVAGHKCEHHRARGTENNKNKTQFISVRKVRSGSLRIAMCVRESGRWFAEAEQRRRRRTHDVGPNTIGVPLTLDHPRALPAAGAACALHRRRLGCRLRAIAFKWVATAHAIPKSSYADKVWA